MRKEDNFCSIEQGIALANMGIVPGNYLYEETRSKHENQISMWEVIEKDQSIKATTTTRYHNTYSCAELGAMLPDGDEMLKDLAQFKTYRVWKGTEQNPNKVNEYCCQSDYSWGEDNCYRQTFGETEAQAKAAMIIFLLEQRMVPVKTINKRLHT